MTKFKKRGMPLGAKAKYWHPTCVGRGIIVFLKNNAFLIPLPAEALAKEREDKGEEQNRKFGLPDLPPITHYF